MRNGFRVVCLSFRDVIILLFSAMGAPPHSAINVLDFKSPKHLVSHLEKLHRHDELYAEYFWWKDFYVVRNRMEDRAQAYCDLCQVGPLTHPLLTQKESGS